MSNPGSGDDTQSPLPEDFVSSRSAAKLLRPGRRSFGLPLLIFGVVALLVTIGVSRIVPVDRPQDESPPLPKRPDRFERAMMLIKPASLSYRCCR